MSVGDLSRAQAMTASIAELPARSTESATHARAFLADTGPDEARILVVDDEPANTALLSGLLSRWGYCQVQSTNEPTEVVGLCADIRPDLVILDLQMPGLDGYQIMAQLRPWTSGPTELPVLVITADATPETKRRALAAGAKDFLTKPFDFEEVRLRVGNLLHTRRLQEELRRHSDQLEARVRERTREAETAHLEVVQRLAVAAEYRDDDTGQHTRRVARTAGRLAVELGLPLATVRLITLAAPLHDVGKIAIPDSVLLKPGRFTPPEFERMKMHVQKGAQMLSGSTSPLLQMAREIALTHHERWDGQGYALGLAGENIPLSGRLVAVADVFDALTHERPYKQAWPLDQAIAEIARQAGKQFDPQAVDAFMRLDHHQLLQPVSHAENLPQGHAGDGLGSAEEASPQLSGPGVEVASALTA